MERNAGTTVFSRLELLREETPTVGVQVFGPTWAVLDTTTGELGRACLLDTELLPDQAARDAFVTAMNGLADLRELSLVPQLYASADDHGAGVLYEPLAGGVAFDDLYDGTSPIDLAAEVGRLARHLARALAALHGRGAVHGMLTSACVFIGPRGPAVYQYGLAPLCDRKVLLRRVRAFGLANMAPEVLDGGPITPVADLYAWAVTVAQFASGLRGAPAIEAILGPQDWPGLPAVLRAAVQSCLANDPAARPRDGVELLRTIEAAGLEGSGAVQRSETSDVIAVSAATAPEPTPPATEPEPAPVVAPATPDTSPPASSPSPASAPAKLQLPPPPLAKPGGDAFSRAGKTPGTFAKPASDAGKGPPAGMSVPMASFEDMLLTSDRQRRPATIPPSSAASAAPLASASSSSAGTSVPTGSTGSSSTMRSVIELTPEDLLSESGAWSRGGQPSARSASNLRRVHVLTDPLKRGGEVSGVSAEPPSEVAPEVASGAADTAKSTEPALPPGPADLIIGGTREEVESASRATTVRLEPVAAADAVQAANAALESASDGNDQDDRDDREPAAPQTAADSRPASSAMRRRSSAMAGAGNAEPRDWGTIPPLTAVVPDPPPTAPGPQPASTASTVPQPTAPNQLAPPAAKLHPAIVPAAVIGILVLLWWLLT